MYVTYPWHSSTRVVGGTRQHCRRMSSDDTSSRCARVTGTAGLRDDQVCHTNDPCSPASPLPEPALAPTPELASRPNPTLARCCGVKYLDGSAAMSNRGAMAHTSGTRALPEHHWAACSSTTLAPECRAGVVASSRVMEPVRISGWDSTALGPRSRT